MHLNNTFTCPIFRCSVFKLWSEYWTKFSSVFEYQTIRGSDNFRPFKYQTSPVFRSPLYKEKKLKIELFQDQVDNIETISL